MSDVILYTTDDGATKIELRLEDGTVWLSQLQIADLFSATKQNISLHLKNIFEEEELSENSVVKESLTTAADDKNYRTKLYNLDAILAVGYRVRSPRGSAFRRWASTVLKEYLEKGFAMNDERLKNLGVGFATPRFVSTKGASRYQHSPQGYDSRPARNIGLKDRRIVCMAETPPPSFGLSDLVIDLSFYIALRAMLVSDRSIGAGEQHMHFADPTVRPHTIRENSCPHVLRRFSEVGFVVENLEKKGTTNEHE